MKFLSRDSGAKPGFEGALIGASILLALSIESWRMEQQRELSEQPLVDLYVVFHFFRFGHADS